MKLRKKNGFVLLSVPRKGIQWDQGSKCGPCFCGKLLMGRTWEGRESKRSHKCLNFFSLFFPTTLKGPHRGLVQSPPKPSSPLLGPSWLSLSPSPVPQLSPGTFAVAKTRFWSRVNSLRWISLRGSWCVSVTLLRVSFRAGCGNPV